jgi:hypothetical protein
MRDGRKEGEGGRREEEEGGRRRREEGGEIRKSGVKHRLMKV